MTAPYLEVEGGHQLTGEVTVAGAKNSALKLMCAALLTSEPVILDNIPDLDDVRVLCELLQVLGAAVTRPQPGRVVIQAAQLHPRAPFELVSKMRASVTVMGPLLGRLQRAEVALPGGCSIGARPLDLTQTAFEHMGLKFSLEHGYMLVKGQPQGAAIQLRIPSVSATENVILAAVLGAGTTTLHNAACEPEIADLAGLLKAMGAQIHGAGTPLVTIHGVSGLHGAQWRTMPDRIEAGTYIIAAALLAGPAGVRIRGVPLPALESFLAQLKAVGVAWVIEGQDTVWVPPAARLTAVDLTTDYFPGIATDLQAAYTILATQCQGATRLHETIYENRLMHLPELQKMGAKIDKLDNQRAIITGPTPLSGAHVESTDLRASAALVLAALVADGWSRVYNLHHLDRGYERFEGKLAALGARLQRVAPVAA